MDWLEKQIKTFIAAKHDGDRLVEEGNFEDANRKLQEALETLDRAYRREHDETFQLLTKCWSAIVEKNIEMGDQAAAEENYTVAREHYQIALDLAPTKQQKDEIRVKLGRTGPEKATTSLSAAFDEVEANPSSPEAIDKFATELAFEGYFPEAVTYFEKLVEVTPDDAEAHLKLANALADCERFDEAERVYNKAREMGVDEAEIDYRLGEVQNARGDHMAAIRSMRRAIDRKPDLVDAHRSLAHLCAISGDYDDSIGAFQEVLKLDPEDSEAHFELGNLFEIKGQMDRAREEWQKATEADPESDFASFARDKLEAAEESDEPR